jgi:transposase
MYVRKSKNNNGRIYLSIVQGYRDELGKAKQRTIEKLGYLDDLEKLYDDPYAHFSAIAKKRTKEEVVPDLIIKLSEKLSPQTNNRKNLGYSVLQKIYNELSIGEFFQEKQRKTDVSFNLNSIFRLLVYSRILKPGSKQANFNNRESFFENFKFSLKDIYRSLSHFNACKEELQSYLHKRIKELYGRNTDVAYYDCTNYYFEIGHNDEDTYQFDETGEVCLDEEGNPILLEVGLRKKGPSKENKKSPIVQMGLLMDNDGLPMAYHLFPGNESEKTSLNPILSKTKRSFELDKVIIVADRGLNTSDNIFYNKRELDGYVFSQTVKGADKEFKTYALKDEDFVDCSDGSRYKWRVKSKDIQIMRNGKRTCKINVIQKQVIIYSEKYAERARHEREKILQKAEKLIANPGTYTKATSHGAAGYVKNLAFDKDTGEIIEKDLSIDWEKIREEEAYDGYYAIVTSELEKSPEEIREIYRGLWKIEESFKITKSDFEARPVYVSKKEHIEAHFFICFVSLLILRLLEKKLNGKYSVRQIIDTLNNYSCSHLQDNYFIFDYRNELIEDIEQIFNIDLSHKIMSRKKIKEILSNV